MQDKMANTVTLPEGALIVENMEDKAEVARLKGLCLNMAILLREILY